MKIKVPLVLVATTLLACSATVSADHHCANLPSMKLTIKQYSIDLDDNRPVCITVPGAFIIDINNPPGGGHKVNEQDVTVRQKVEPADATVTIEGNSVLVNNKLMLAVTVEQGPQWPPEEGEDEFEFWVEIANVGMLDPRIKVVPSIELMIQQVEAVDDVLATWDLTYEEFESIRRQVLAE